MHAIVAVSAVVHAIVAVDAVTYVIVFVVGRSLIAEDEQKIIGEAADAVRKAIEFGKRTRR